MKNDDIIYFSVNNWFCGRDYPPTENFKRWLRNDLKQAFRNDGWAKENKLCIYYGMIDMSQNYTVSAPREWVEKNCPELLSVEEYTYYTVTSRPKKRLFGGYKYEEVREEHKKKYSDFVYTPEEDEDTPDCDRFDMPFREYCEKNFGSEYYETGYWDEPGDEEDDEYYEEEEK